jgi:thiopeptide-type bacteriocin biosynthesis protein
MRYQFADHILLRMPAKNPANYRSLPQSFLNDPFFLAALKLATPRFFALLESKGFQAGELSAKEKYTLQKYINRYCFRPTPFGLFASVSLTKWGIPPEETKGPPNLLAHISTAMPVQHQLYEKWRNLDMLDQTIFEPNPSLYRVLQEYRFIRTGLEEAGQQREYQLQSIAFSKVLKNLLKLCSTGCSKNELIRYIMKAADCEPAEAADYADFLIDAQLLVHKSRMTITGPEHLNQIAGMIREDPLKSRLRNYLNRQDVAGEAITPGHIGKLEDELQKLIPGQELAADRLSIILKRQASYEALSPRFQEQLRDGITALGLLSANGRSSMMAQFISSFQQHFEGQTLPLLQALDPEAGIGYQHPERERNNPLLETLNIPYRYRSKQSHSWTSGHRLLMESWLEARSSDNVIRVKHADLAELSSGSDEQPILGMSVLFRIAENKVYIENAGGINAPALIGRFTVAGEAIADAARKMAGELEEQNPDVIFAELLHLADPHTDNVNRRAQIYHYEIPVTAASALAAERQLPLSDLYIRIINEKAFLFSERHQKIVIPRLSSAYNHSLNKLPLFRFLADLPYQYGRSDLGLDLRQYFPDLRFYPRVEYKDAILSLATWILSAEQISTLSSETDGPIAVFNLLSAAIKLPRYFSLAEGDQELVFDGQSDQDVDLFINTIQQKKEVRLKEFLNQPEIRQYNAYLLPEEPLRLPEIGSVPKTRTKTQRKYIPGSSWLYLKVYAPKIGVNRLLIRLLPLLHKRYGGHQISQWFFIRYDDHAPHIRLRLRIDPVSINELLIAFKTKLEDRIQQHVIREFQIDVYSRELERYAAGGIEHTERAFWTSSELVLQYFKRGAKNLASDTPIFALYSTYVMVNLFIMDSDEQITFTLQSYQQFLPEFTDKPFKAELDKKYRELTPEIQKAFNAADPAILCGSLKAGESFVDSLEAIRQAIGSQPTWITCAALSICT